MKKLNHTYRTTIIGSVSFLLISCSTMEKESGVPVPADPGSRAPGLEELVVTAQKSSRPAYKRQRAKVVIRKEDNTYSGVAADDKKTERQGFAVDIASREFWNPQRSHQIFRSYGVNPTVLTEAKPDSTFAMDVDDGSYRLAQTMLKRGLLPEPAGIRVEEFVNAMRYQYQSTDDLFSLSAEAAPSPFRDGYHILHFGVQARDIKDEERLPANLVLIADISGSMGSDNKLELLKEGFMTLVGQLNKSDRVALVTYSDSAKLILKSTVANKKRKIFAAINKLKADGSTNAQDGIALGYDTAESMFEPGFINRVILTSDGMANVGATSPEEILDRIRKQRQKGIFLTTVGVGVGMYNDWLLEQLANQGNGHYLYLADTSDIQSAFVDGLNRQLQTVAKNAKIQVLFNPNLVSHYRLLGYENRALNKEDFLDANKDGGEIGAGHRVTALYEVRLRQDSDEQQLGELSIAYQKPEGAEVHTLKKAVPVSIIQEKIAQASSDLRLSASVAAFAEKLRLSYWAQAYSYQDILDLLASLPNSYMQTGQVQSLREAIRGANSRDRRINPYAEENVHSTLNLDHVPLLR